MLNIFEEVFLTNPQMRCGEVEGVSFLYELQDRGFFLSFFLKTSVGIRYGVV